MPLKLLKDFCADHGLKPTGILHVGAAMLEEADQYRDMGVKTVIWIEADLPSDRRQKRATEFGHALYECCALSDRCGLVKFSVASNEASSSILPFARHSTIYPDIVVTEERHLLSIRADQVFNEGLVPEIDTLVLDVQGAELKVLKGMGKLINQIKIGFLEVNITELYQGCVLQPELDDWMAKAGFTNKDFQMVHTPEYGECLYWR